MNLIVVGASAGLGRALAEALAKEGNALLLVASDEADLDAQISDLRIRFSARCEKVAAAVICDQLVVDQIVSAAKSLGQIDGLLFPLGFSRDDDDGSLSPADVDRIIQSNVSGIIALTQAFLPEMLVRGQGTLVYFGSVAAERGRNANIVYAAAKRGLRSFAESIRHLCSSTAIKVQYYQLGYLDTAQTFGKKLLFPVGDREKAARYITRNLNRDFGFMYYPWFWRFISLGLRYLPWFIFRRLRF